MNSYFRNILLKSLLIIIIFASGYESKATIVPIPITPGTDTTSFMPTNRRYDYSATRMIFTASELGGVNGTVKSISFQKASGDKATSINYIHIYMKETTVSTVTTSIPLDLTTGYRLVGISTPIDNSVDTGWVDIPLQTTFPNVFTYSGGTMNIDVIMVKSSSETKVSGSLVPVYRCHTTTTNLAAYSFGSSAPGAGSAMTVSTKRPNVRLNIEYSCSGKPSKGTISGPTTPVCPNTNFDLKATGLSFGDGMSFQWQERELTGGSFFTDLGSPKTTTPIDITASITADKEYRLISHCTLSDQKDTSNTINIKVLKAASLSASSDTVFCNGSGVLLNATTTTSVINTWYRDNVSLGVTGGSYIASLAGVYKVVSTSTSCIAGVESNTKTVIVNANPNAVIDAGANLEVCDGRFETLNASPITGMTFQWQRGGINISGATTSSLNVSSAGKYTVIIKNSATGCTKTSDATEVKINPSPVKPTITSTTGKLSFCSGESLSLSYVPTFGTTYQWYSRTGVISGAVGSSLTVSNPSKYIVIATLGSCITSSDSIEIKEDLLPNTVLTPLGTYSICIGDSMLFSANYDADYEYTWLESGVPYIHTKNASEFYVKEAGTYNVKITNTKTGCLDYTGNVTLDVTTPVKPIVTPSSATIFCEGTNVTFNGVVDPNQVLQWYNADPFVPIPGEVSSSYTTNINGKYFLQGKDLLGCIAQSDTFEVNVMPIPKNTVTITGDVTICEGTSTKLQAQNSKGYTYQWRNHGADIPGETFNPFYAKEAGSFTVFIKDSNGCSVESNPIEIKVNKVAPFMIIPNGNTFFCNGDSTILFSNSKFNNHQWYRNGVEIFGATDTFIVAKLSGDYVLRVQDLTNFCWGNSKKLKIVTLEIPNTPSIFRTGSTLSTDLTGVKYQWYKDGVLLPKETNSSITITEEFGIYKLVVKNENDCDNSNTYDLSTTSFNESEQLQVRIYPNPASEILHIDLPEGYNYIINDIYGKNISGVTNHAIFDLSNVANGILLIQIYDQQNNLIAVQKIIKK
jgi:hypothetical protein